MRLVIGESVLTSESLDSYEALRVFFDVAGERGHSAPSVVVDERGVPLTHPDYVDRMGAAHISAGAWAFCRRPSAEALGLPSGTDWVRDHALHLMFQEGSPYLPEPHLHDQVYLQRFDADRPLPMAPVSSASPIAWNNEGSRMCSLEIRLGHITDNTGMAGYVLWEHEMSLGRRRRIAAFPATARMDFAQVSYSCDDSWIHLCEWVSGRNFLIRVADGLVVALPVASTAMNWNTRNGPSAMIAMTLDAPTGRLVIYDYDLATNTLQHRSDLASPTGLPLSVRELSMSADGYLALVTAPVGVPGLEQAERGGVHVAAVIDVDDGSIEPVLPVSFRTRSAQRRHTSPRWCEEQARNGSHHVAVADQLMMDASPAACDPDSAEVSQDLLRRWTEVLAGITAAWEVGRIPTARFADEYVQYAISCYELDEDAASQAVAALRQRARTDQAARTIIRALDSYRDRQWRPTAVLPVPEPSTPTGGTSPAEASITAAASTGVPEDVLTAALDRLIGAESIGAATAAARGLMQLAEPYRFRGGPWQVLAQASTEALARANFVLATKLGLATAFWQAFFRPEMMASGLPQVPTSALLPILLNCFEACTHLPERTVIGADAQSIFDVEEVRDRCQRALSDLPIADYLNTTPRNRVTAGPGTSRVPNPSDVDLAEGDSPVADPGG